MTDPMTSWAQPEGQDPAPLGQGPDGAPRLQAPPAPQGGQPAPAPAGLPPTIRPKSSGGSRLTNALLVVAALVAVGGVAFAGGRLTAPAGASSDVAGVSGRFQRGSFDPGQGAVPDGSFDPAQGGPGGFGGLGGDRSLTLTGTVKSLDGSTLVITTADGSELSIDVSGSAYHAQAAASAADVTAGTDVAVSVEGVGGFRGPASSANPNGDSGSTSVRATDITIVTK